MPFLYVRHKVEDYNKWFAIFDSHKTAHQESGLADCKLARDVEDPNIVTIFFRVTDIMKAREFTSTPEAYEAKDASGVIGDPEFYWLDEI